MMTFPLYLVSDYKKKIMKKILLALLTICITMSVSAQSEYISNSRYDVADCFGDLDGRGGIMLLSKKNDLVITVSDSDAEIRHAKHTLEKIYAYEIAVSMKNDVKVEVSHRGEVFSTEFVVGKKYLKENVFLAYMIEDVERPIQQNEQSKQTKVVFDEKLAAVEIISSMEDLQIDCPELLARGTEMTVNKKNGIVTTTLTIPLKVIRDAKAEVARLENERDNLNKILLDQNVPQKEKTEERWNRVDWLDNTGIKEKECLVESLTHISVYGKGTNRLDINIDREGKLAPRKTQSYGILLMKTIEKVHVSECAGFMDEGGRQYALRKYDAARVAFKNALTSKDTPPTLIPTIKTSIAQCDSCLKYEQLLIRALRRIGEMKQNDKAVIGQTDIVNYYGAAIDFMTIINKYNPCEYYTKNIKALETYIENMPFDLRFNIVKWTVNRVSAVENGPFPNIELWAYYGGGTPRLMDYSSDRRFRKLVSASSADYKLIGTSDGGGTIDMELNRKSLPTGFFFRSATDGMDAPISYKDMTDVMSKSEGEYSKRQFRLKMYVKKEK